MFVSIALFSDCGDLNMKSAESELAAACSRTDLCAQRGSPFWKTHVVSSLIFVAFASVVWSQGETEGLVRESKFIFKGTVKRLEATTLASVQPNKETAVVSVDEVLTGPDALRGFTGREITVLLKKGESFKAHEIVGLSIS